MRAASKKAEASEGREMVNLGLVGIVMVVVLVEELMVVGGGWKGQNKIDR